MKDGDLEVVVLVLLAFVVGFGIVWRLCRP